MNVSKNGPQLGADNHARFEAWISERERANDWANYLRRGALNRSEIASECGFDRKVFGTNPSIKARLAEIELFHAESFSAAAIQQDDDGANDAAESAVFAQRAAAAKAKLEARVKSLEERNAALSAEVSQLRAQLARYSHIDEHLADTGRLVRP